MSYRNGSYLRLRQSVELRVTTRSRTVEDGEGRENQLENASSAHGIEA